MLGCWEVMDAGDPALGGGYQEGQFNLALGDISAPQRSSTMEDPLPCPQRQKKKNSCTKVYLFHDATIPEAKKEGGVVGVGGESRLRGGDWIVGRSPEGLMPL